MCARRMCQASQAIRERLHIVLIPRPFTPQNCRWCMAMQTGGSQERNLWISGNISRDDGFISPIRMGLLCRCRSERLRGLSVFMTNPMDFCWETSHRFRAEAANHSSVSPPTARQIHTLLNRHLCFVKVRRGLMVRLLIRPKPNIPPFRYSLRTDQVLSTMSVNMAGLMCRLYSMTEITRNPAVIRIARAAAS